MAWDIEVMDECAVVRMSINKVNVQNDQFLLTSTEQSSDLKSSSTICLLC